MLAFFALSPGQAAKCAVGEVRGELGGFLGHEFTQNEPRVQVK